MEFDPEFLAVVSRFIKVVTGIVLVGGGIGVALLAWDYIARRIGD